jgi:4-amino-4-deoxy-L-arabinose transferase-like glycosyltransferase
MLTGLSLVMRFFSFFPSVMDHDESTYLVIADALREGKVYLRDVIDTKPIGIFTLFAAFQILFGKSIIVLRIITAIWIALTAWMLYLAHRELIKDSPGYQHNPAPVASGVIYVFIISILPFMEYHRIQNISSICLRSQLSLSSCDIKVCRGCSLPVFY